MSRKSKKRDISFAKKISTKIFHEEPSYENPYISRKNYCHGYNTLDLLKKRSFFDFLYLLFRGDLPNSEQESLLEKLFIAFSNPGPRHPATRTAMLSGVSKVENENILPLSLCALSGAFMGAREVELCVRFLRKNKQKAISEVTAEFISPDSPVNFPPGFGRIYGGKDLYSADICEEFLKYRAIGSCFIFGNKLAEIFDAFEAGWLQTGLVAAVLADLGFHPNAAAGIYQIISSPGLLAHGIEMVGKPLTSMPFLQDEDYTIE